MVHTWLGAAILITGLNWLAVWFGWRRINYASKVLVILLLIVWLGISTGFNGMVRFFAIGTLFSLAGDILLLMPAKFFLLGLCSFLLTHICYLIGFFSPPPVINAGVIWVGLIMMAFWVLVFGIIRSTIDKNPDYRRLKMPLVVYSLGICAMAGSAAMTLFHPFWPSPAAGLATSGGLLFLFSDMQLAYDRFLQPLPDVRLWKRVSYHLGQIAIIAAVVLRASSQN